MSRYRINRALAARLIEVRKHILVRVNRTTIEAFRTMLGHHPALVINYFQTGVNPEDDNVFPKRILQNSVKLHVASTYSTVEPLVEQRVKNKKIYKLYLPFEASLGNAIG